MFLVSRSPVARSTGFSLIEVLVGLAIGMLATIVILQVFALSGEKQRNTASGNDAQSNGAIAFYQLQQDIGQAGYGFAASRLFNCNVKWPASSTGTNIAATIPLAPVTINPDASIIPDGDPNTDRLLIIYGNTNQEPQGNDLAATQTAATAYKPKLISAFNIGDYLIAYPNPCSSTLLIEQITDIPTTGANTNNVVVQTGTSGLDAVTLYDMGKAPTMVAYAIRNGNLTMCDYRVNDCGAAGSADDTAVWVPIANNIVSMRAQYWHDSDNNGTPDTSDQVTPTGVSAACNWTRTSLIRLVLVARNSELSKDEVTSDVATTDVPIPNAPTWIGSKVETGNTVLEIDLTKNPDNSNNTNWKHYRYKTFQSVTPIRNVAWMTKC